MTVACNLITYDSKLFEEWGVEEPTEDMTFSELVDLAEKNDRNKPCNRETELWWIYVFKLDRVVFSLL